MSQEINDFLCDNYIEIEPNEKKIEEPKPEPKKIKKEDLAIEEKIEEKSEIDDLLIDECEENRIFKEYEPEVDQKTLDYQMSVADEIGKILDSRFMNVLAGGAPRDWTFGKTASDLDFYVVVSTKETEIIKTLEELFNSKITIKWCCYRFKESDGQKKTAKSVSEYSEGEHSSFNSDTIAILETVYKDIDVDFIINSSSDLNSKITNKEITKNSFYEEFIKPTFDIGLCMIYYADNKIVKTKEFENDFLNKQITFYIENLYSFSSLVINIKNHFSKIIRKFPDYVVDVKTSEMMQKSFDCSFSNYRQLFDKKKECL